MSYNICGLKGKMEDFLFRKYVQSFDLIFFMETHVDCEFDMYCEYLNDFKLYWVPAVKINNQFLVVTIKSLQPVVNIIPVYLNCYSWDQDFSELVEVLLKLIFLR